MNKNKCGCPPNKCSCGVEKCKKYSSEMVYDGCTVPGTGAVNGRPLNQVIEQIARDQAQQAGATLATYHESFDKSVEQVDGSSYVTLKVAPNEILLVTHCGGVLPPDAYKNTGKTLTISKDYCHAGQDIQVIYKAGYLSSSQNCYT